MQHRPDHGNSPRLAALIWLALFIAIGPGQAQDSSFTNLLAQGDRAEKRGDVAAAMKSYAAAEIPGTTCTNLCLLARRYCDLMHDVSPAATQKELAQKALACAQRAVKADSKNSTAHLSLAVCYAKNFPYVDNATKVNMSRAMKTECETGLALDPKQDVGYYLLGRWYFGTANMGVLSRGFVKLAYGGLPEASNDDAIRNFKAAIALAPRRIIHHAELAKVYAATGDKKLEIAELELCARLKPLDLDDTDAQQEAARQLAEIR